MSEIALLAGQQGDDLGDSFPHESNRLALSGLRETAGQAPAGRGLVMLGQLRSDDLLALPHQGTAAYCGIEETEALHDEKLTQPKALRHPISAASLLAAIPNKRPSRTGPG
ncbi:hypothetical protein [Bosea sp. WAO]|uniref:hypothetical protein n=1 Tax=Bosea sp. WAO TaxID=406341 RepID=UPI0018260E6A